MSSAFADLESRNQELQSRVLELEAQQLSFSLYQRQLNDQLDSLRKNREEMSRRYEELQKRVQQEREALLDAIRVRNEQNSRLMVQLSILNNQKQHYESSLEKVKETYQKMEEELQSKARLIAQLTRK